MLDRGHLTLRQREIVIDRTTALCRSEYEWRVHVAIFGGRIGLTEDQMYSLIHGDAEDACWSAEDRVLIRYRTVSYLTNALQLEPERNAATFPVKRG